MRFEAVLGYIASVVALTELGRVRMMVIILVGDLRNIVAILLFCWLLHIHVFYYLFIYYYVYVYVMLCSCDTHNF